MKIFTDKMGIWSKSEDGTTSWPIQTPLTTQDWTFTGTKAYNSSLFTVQAPTVKLDCTTVQLKSTGADIALKWGSSTGNMVLYNSGNIVMNGYIVQKNNRGNLEFRKPCLKSKRSHLSKFLQLLKNVSVQVNLKHLLYMDLF